MEPLSYDLSQPIGHNKGCEQRKTWAYNNGIKPFNRLPGYSLSNTRKPDLGVLVCKNVQMAAKSLLRAKRPEIAAQHLCHGHFLTQHVLRYLSTEPGLSYEYCMGKRNYQLEADYSSRNKRLQSDQVEPMIWLAVLFDDNAILAALRDRFIEGNIAGSVARPADFEWQMQLLSALGYGFEELRQQELYQMELDRLKEQRVTRNFKLYLEKVRWPLTQLYFVIKQECSQHEFEQNVYHVLKGYHDYWQRILKDNSFKHAGFHLESGEGVFFGLCAAVRLANRRLGHRLSFRHPAIPDVFCYADWPALDFDDFKLLPPHPDDAPNPFDLV